jgi:hypothetical protein
MLEKICGSFRSRGGGADRASCLRAGFGVLRRSPLFMKFGIDSSNHCTIAHVIPQYRIETNGIVRRRCGTRDQRRFGFPSWLEASRRVNLLWRLAQWLSGDGAAKVYGPDGPVRHYDPVF